MIENLKKLRQKKGVSQQRLAEVLGVTQQAVNQYENHAIEPDIYILTKMADYFNVSIDYLVGRTGDKRRADTVRPYDLNADEAELIDKYRQLLPRERESIHLVSNNYIERAK